MRETTRWQGRKIQTAFLAIFLDEFSRRFSLTVDAEPSSGILVLPRNGNESGTRDEFLRPVPPIFPLA